MSKRPYLLGLTGSIAMGKSTTAAQFADEGIPVWDADAVVRKLYGPGGKGVSAIGALVPGAVIDGVVNRDRLKNALGHDPSLLPKIEAAIHPLVAQDRIDFIEENIKRGSRMVVLDIPLLFETSAEKGLDGVVVVTCQPDIQRQRLAARTGMSAEALALIMSRQMPDAQKRRKADFIIDTSLGIEDARQQVQAVIARIRRENQHA